MVNMTHVVVAKRNDPPRHARWSTTACVLRQIKGVISCNLASIVALPYASIGDMTALYFVALFKRLGCGWYVPCALMFISDRRTNFGSVLCSQLQLYEKNHQIFKLCLRLKAELDTGMRECPMTALSSSLTVCGMYCFLHLSVCCILKVWYGEFFPYRIMQYCQQLELQSFWKEIAQNYSEEFNHY